MLNHPGGQIGLKLSVQALRNLAGLLIDDFGRTYPALPQAEAEPITGCGRPAIAPQSQEEINTPETQSTNQEHNQSSQPQGMQEAEPLPLNNEPGEQTNVTDLPRNVMNNPGNGVARAPVSRNRTSRLICGNCVEFIIMLLIVQYNNYSGLVMVNDNELINTPSDDVGRLGPVFVRKINDYKDQHLSGSMKFLPRTK
ncbi:hypothetical protein OCU04_000534 [Sclerotinia nivalis]|uniref:Uncharacterized protein n=1 Tax=Sclerotinia nivalis TaxID=352851 RepID=A0A9X0DQD6_9HELO|nr:hypothetical protein OCU04_000534 [Sclerotinia nivalis]